VPNHAELPRWFLIVRGDKPGLCEHLRESYVGDGRVEVLVDRRLTTSAEVPAEASWRRTEHSSYDRRQAHRRQPLAPAQQYFWVTEGFFLVRRAPDAPPA
jgi:hypothetical protein